MTKDSTLMMEGNGSKADISERCEQLRNLIKQTSSGRWNCQCAGGFALLVGLCVRVLVDARSVDMRLWERAASHVWFVFLRTGLPCFILLLSGLGSIRDHSCVSKVIWILCLFPTPYFCLLFCTYICTPLCMCMRICI